MKISLGQQIEEIERELQMRSGVFPGLVARGKMRQSVADLHKARMNAVLDTLIWLQANEETIRTAIAKKEPA